MSAPTAAAVAARPLQILYVAEHVPFVPAAGGTTRTYHLVAGACQAGSVTLLALCGLPADPRYTAIRGLCREVRIAAPFFTPTPLPPAEGGGPPAPPRLSRRLARSVFRRLPYRGHLLLVLARLLLRLRLIALLRRRRFDAVIVEHTALAAALAPIVRRLSCPALAALQDVDSVMAARAAALAGTGSGLGSRLLIRRRRQQERMLLRSYRLITVPSDEDVRRLPRRRGAVAAAVPNGVDSVYWAAPVPPLLPPAPRIIFTGKLNHPPNSDAIDYLVTQVWPLLRAARPGLELLLVGTAPVPPALTRLAEQPGISLHVSVPDVRPYLRASAVAVVPLRFGSGTRLKILEALAAGVPVVSTTLGAEGLALRAGQEIQIADDPASFSAAVLRCLDDPEPAAAMAARGRAIARRHYDWATIRAQFAALVRDTARHRGLAARPDR